jgi:alkylation response protein AidB-like acyl-CoA dehydrogenase
MNTPGITVRPIREMTGAAEFCEVFFDDVRLPADAVLGEVDKGWDVATAGLASERSYVGANAVQLDLMHSDLVALARAVRLDDGRSALEHEDVQQQVAAFWTRVLGVQLLVRDAAARAVVNRDTPVDGPEAKLAYTELNVSMCEYAIELLATGQVGPEHADLVHRWEHAQLWSRALTISGGSSQIITGVLAQAMLGLPRSWSRRQG